MCNVAFLVPNPASLHSLHSMVGACSYCSLGNPMPWEPCRHVWLGLGQENSSDPPRAGRQWAGAMGKEGLQGPLLAPRYLPEAGAVSSPGSLLGNGIWASSWGATGGLSQHWPSSQAVRQQHAHRSCFCGGGCREHRDGD